MYYFFLTLANLLRFISEEKKTSVSIKTYNYLFYNYLSTSVVFQKMKTSSKINVISFMKMPSILPCHLLIRSKN